MRSRVSGDLAAKLAALVAVLWLCCTFLPAPVYAQSAGDAISDADIDAAIERLAFSSTDQLHELTAGEHPVRMCQQHRQQTELHAAQRKNSPVETLKCTHSSIEAPTHELITSNKHGIRIARRMRR